MNARLPRALAAGLVLAGLTQLPPAQAGIGDLLNQAGGSSASGLGGLSAGSLSSGSSSNAAGVLEYCIKNNYLNEDAASNVKDKLLSKLPGNTTSSDSSYKKGASGILSTSDGKQLDLSGDGLKKKVTQQVCEKILSQSKSLL
ncbi:MAG: hypothetical protein GAK45_02330 [Pseudomonas citronellolis]|nr:MAG: hypothetical protein GAK45_02330 [Pseudomonas citronellolis]